jgi:mannobiose 2-epimerase
MTESQFTFQIESELTRILRFWTDFSIDHRYGGFVGKMDVNGQVQEQAEKGGVLNARILWTFAAAYLHSPQAIYLSMANRAYHYLQTHFRDKDQGGIYWSVDFAGNPLNKRKQIYGLAFGIYGLSAYYKLAPRPEVLEFALDLYQLIEQHSYDVQRGGYYEAFSSDWQLLDDLRLSEKDRNDPKTMNTHLHIIEAYVNLYRIWPKAELAERIRQLLEVFENHIIDAQSNHLILFFDLDWKPQSAARSYGHDIEASWLLHEAASVLEDPALLEKWSSIALKIANAATEGLQPDGSFFHEYDPSNNHYDRHREWWVTAEGMVGYLNAFELTGDPSYWEKIVGLWNFAQKHLIDHQNGEWYWGVFDDYEGMNSEDKIGFWKCPYHNSRACMEILSRTLYKK